MDRIRGRKEPAPKPLLKKQIREKLGKHADARSLEAAVSHSIVKQLRSMGIFAQKMSERFAAGWPDIYACGGIHIETKVIPLVTGEPNYPLKHFTAQQRDTLDMLTQQGDMTFAAVYWVIDRSSRAFMLMPWDDFRRIVRWYTADVLHFSVTLPKGSDDYQLERLFDSKHVLKYNQELWWKDRWLLWMGIQANHHRYRFHIDPIEEIRSDPSEFLPGEFGEEPMPEFDPLRGEYPEP